MKKVIGNRSQVERGLNETKIAGLGALPTRTLVGRAPCPLYLKKENGYLEFIYKRNKKGLGE